MKEKLVFKKTCSIHASDLHFATVIFPYITKKIEENTTVRTILERNEEENIEKVIKNVGLNSELKEKIRKIDWKESDIIKIRKKFKLLEEDILNKENINIIVLGTNIFIKKVNRAIELWIKNNSKKVQEKEIEINVINCYSIEESKEMNKIINQYDYILKTSGLEEIITAEELLKAN